MSDVRIAVACCVHDDHYFLNHALASFAPAGDLYTFVSTVPWNGTPGNWEQAAKVAREASSEVILGEWPAEILHRAAMQQWLLERGYTHAIMPDGDEIAEPQLVTSLVKLAHAGLAQRVMVHMDTYWKEPDCIIRPRESIHPIIMIELDKVVPEDMNSYNGRLFCKGKGLILPPEFGILHHLSYCGPDERILRKIQTWSHAHEVLSTWYRQIWLGFDADPLMRELHPTHPFAYGWAERIPLPDCLENIPRYRPKAVDPLKPRRWPSLSIIIPLYGGEIDIRMCLNSLEACRDLFSEVVVVDDVSPDGAAEVAESFTWARVLRNERNLGFAGTCNRGFEESTGDVVIFLNSDTIIPRAGLIRLIESLMPSGAIGAVGPYTNCSAYHQSINPTYTKLEHLDLFATDFAARTNPDLGVQILVGFCVAARRTTLEEVGGPFDEAFGRGTFEDNDLCYRLLRAGYQLKVSARSYIHHTGHRSLARLEFHPDDLLYRNEALYREKWRDDLESGFASHLPGDSAAPIVFDPAKRPEKRAAERALLVKQADITLCMIVRNEERVLEDCLRSIQGVFSQVVIVDTGSTDRTKEIARAHGAELFELPWPESFAEARNESLKHARGRWIMWMDADDTLPSRSADAILQSAATAPEPIVGFVFPVRFTDGGSTGGTQVDHVKLFRNLPGVRFEGRIHEQVLQSLRPHGEIARLPNAVVLHSGYDTSVEGQAAKRERDAHLLHLDLADRPQHPFVLFNLGMTAHYNGDHEEAVEWLCKSIDASNKNESHVRKAYALLGVSLRELGRAQEALTVFSQGIEAVGSDAELHFQSALVLTNQGRVEEAIQQYLSMPLEQHGYFSSIDVGILGTKRAHNLGALYSELGRLNDARRHFEEASNDGFAPSAIALFELTLGQGDYRASKQALERYKRLAGFGAEYLSALVRLMDATDVDSLAHFRSLVERHPEIVPIRLIFVRMLLGEQREAEAFPHLAWLSERGVAEAAFYQGVAMLRTGDLERALGYMKQAHVLDPSHQPTIDQIHRLEAAMEPVNVRRSRLLTGPHKGELGDGASRLSIVVVTYQSSRHIGTCIANVLAQLEGDDELILVDNDSTDATREIITSVSHADPRVRLYTNERNLGYSRAANLGALKSCGRHILFLNPDAHLGENCLEALLSCMDERVGMAGPLSDAIHGEQDLRSYLSPNEVGSIDETAKTLTANFPGKWRKTRLLMGVCLLIPRQVLDQHGLLEEACELGADDLELSWRLRELGYELRISLSAFVHHQGAASFDQLPYAKRRQWIEQSDANLVSKLKQYYFPEEVPTSLAIWNSHIFDEAFQR